MKLSFLSSISLKKYSNLKSSSHKIRLTTFNEAITVETCCLLKLLKAVIIEIKNSILYVLNPFLNNLDKIEKISNFVTTASKYKFSLLFNKSAKHLNISMSKIFFSIIKLFKREINCSLHISKVSFLINKLKDPSVIKTAFLISLFAFKLRNLLQYSKNFFIYFFVNISLLI